VEAELHRDDVEAHVFVLEQLLQTPFGAIRGDEFRSKVLSAAISAKSN